MTVNRKIWIGIVSALFIAVLVAIFEYKRQIPTGVIARDIIYETEAKSLKFLMVGDTGTGNENQKAVATLMEKLCRSESPEAVILLGDNFYMEGIASVDDPQWNTKFEDMYNTPCLKDKKFYAVLGNHDYKGNPQAQIDYSKTSSKWVLPARYFRFKYGKIVDFFALDSNFPDRCGFASLCSIDWAKSKILESDANWKVTLGHHPILSGGKYKTPSKLAALSLPSLICSSAADLYISGHDHNMQHLRGRFENSNCKIDQLIVGSGGGDLFPPDQVPGKTQFALKDFGVMAATFTAEKLRVEFFTTTSAGSIYSYSKVKVNKKP